jgi:DNA-binding IclR family transcriptional regulator
MRCSSLFKGRFAVLNFCCRSQELFVAFLRMKRMESSAVRNGRGTSNFLRPLESAFRVLQIMARSEGGVRVSELARTLHLPKATVFRILFTLQEIGYARKDPISRAYVSVHAAAWLNHDEGRETLRRVARPYMEKLLARFEQTVNLAVLDREQVLYTEILEGLRSIRMAANVNTYAPVHSTGVGKSMLAFLHPIEAEEILKKRSRSKLTPKTITSVPAHLKAFKRIREQGFAIDNEETETGARCVAAPIFNSQGRPIGAMSVSGPVSHMTGNAVAQIAQALIEATRRVSGQLGFPVIAKAKRHRT